uniref:Photosystem II protein D1 n=1 Tax=Cosmarium obtusatum TaxID=98434 RepID=A0A7M2BUI6_9VIRI|nr:photosystem II protein D1 [Cosmarium obtusatum]
MFPFRYASLDRCCILRSCCSCYCSIPNLPNRTRKLLRRYASRYLWYFQLHDRIPS